LNPFLAFVYGVFLVFSSASCAPNAVLVYPAGEVDAPVEMGKILDDLSHRDRIRIQMAGGDLIEAVFREKKSDVILINEMIWKKQIVGKKFEKSDEVTEIPIRNLERIYVYRNSTMQKIGYGVGAAVFVGAVYSMASAKD